MFNNAVDAEVLQNDHTAYISMDLQSIAHCQFGPLTNWCSFNRTLDVS